jgi:3-dehydroquinate synthase
VPTVNVSTTDTSYAVHIGSGILRTLHARLRKLTPKTSPRLFVVTSPEIWSLWAKRFLASFPKDQQPIALFLPSGEAAKRMASVERLATELHSAGADRDSLLIAFGGGVVGDLTGFLAAIYMRGIGYVGVPSTFLAQVDSSLGGKTGVNLTTGKNLVGSFHHPLAVFSDTDLLQTLPPRELRAGLQESIKAGVIRDAKLFSLMERDAELALHADPKTLEKIVAASVRMKAEVVGLDERESGLRMILNYGHTVGHAIEAATQYKKLLHGEAVAWGMIAANRIALHRDLLTEKIAARIDSLILKYGPLPALKLNAEDLAARTVGDKKNRGGVRRFILPETVGATKTITDVSEAELLRAVREMLALAKKPTT